MTESESSATEPETVLPEDVRAATLEFLQSLESAGVTNIPANDGSHQFEFASQVEQDAASGSVTPVSASESTPAATPSGGSAGASNSPHPAPAPRLAAASLAAGAAYGDPLDESARTRELAQLSQVVSACTRCTELCSSRTQTVFGIGSVKPRLVFFGEGPGADEDRTGEPFVGAAGQLLDKIIQAMTLKREDVFILNTIKCRPPGNRNPGEDEIANCREFWEKQLEILQPEFICCLGAVAARTLMETTQSIGRMRGKFFDYRGSRVIATYHPAYLLRTPSAKRHVWDDMKFLLKGMGIEL